MYTMTKDKEQYYVDNINDELVQIEFIKEIQKGNISFEKNEGIKNTTNVSYYVFSWTSNSKLISLWFENPGFMSFTYLKFGETELNESKIKYYTQICLAIQNKDSKIDLDKRYSFCIPSFDNFISTKKKIRNIRVLENGELKTENV